MSRLRYNLLLSLHSQLRCLCLFRVLFKGLCLNSTEFRSYEIVSKVFFTLHGPILRSAHLVKPSHVSVTQQSALELDPQRRRKRRRHGQADYRLFVPRTVTEIAISLHRAANFHGLHTLHDLGCVVLDFCKNFSVRCTEFSTFCIRDFPHTSTTCFRRI